jgi:hypothetical protein
LEIEKARWKGHRASRKDLGEDLHSASRIRGIVHREHTNEDLHRVVNKRETVPVTTKSDALPGRKWVSAEYLVRNCSESRHPYRVALTII